LQQDLDDRLRERLVANADEFLSGMEYVWRWRYRVGSNRTIDFGAWDG
jgi:hypothetical protein